jgi:hypothetical protein
MAALERERMTTPGIPGSPEHARFRELVSLDVKRMNNDLISQEEREWLRSKELCPYWLNALRDLRGLVQTQFAEKAAELEAYRQACYARGYPGKQDFYTYKAGYERWRANAGRYLSALATRTNEAKLLLEKYKEEAKRLDFDRQRNLLRKSLPHVRGTLLEGEIKELLAHSPSSSAPATSNGRGNGT